VSPFPQESESAEDVLRAMRRGDRFFLARCGAPTVGVVRWAERREFQDLLDKAPYAEVSGLAVLPAWRRLGIGALLLGTAERDALVLGYRHALLRTTFELGLVPWYERLGYAVATTRQLTFPDAPTFLDVVMTRALALETPRRKGQARLRGAPNAH
jgi:GNAT superfamily N-acetyltransferase